jgi:hypothetical protein
MPSTRTKARIAVQKPGQTALDLPEPKASRGHSIVIQRSAVAGYRHHEAPLLWPALSAGAPLDLVREAENTADPDAVAVYWRGRKLGYLPRGENLMAASLLDRRRDLGARIQRLAPRAEHNRRLCIEVLLHGGFARIPCPGGPLDPRGIARHSRWAT